MTKEILKKVGIFAVCVLGACLILFLFCLYIIGISMLPPQIAFIVGITTIGGLFAGIALYCFLTREEYVDVCYKVGEKPEDVRVIAVCSNPFIRHQILEEGDCYRSVPLNSALKEAAWEDLQYKTKNGYMSVE